MTDQAKPCLPGCHKVGARPGVPGLLVHATGCPNAEPAPAQCDHVWGDPQNRDGTRKTCQRCGIGGLPSPGYVAPVSILGSADQECYHCEACALTCSPSQMVCCNCKRVLAGRVFKPAPTPAPASVTPARPGPKALDPQMRFFSMVDMPSRTEGVGLMSEEIKPASDEDIAARVADWQQVALNGGPPCFAVEHGPRFCFRAKRWHGHRGGTVGTHSYVSLETLIVRYAARIESDAKVIAELREKIKLHEAATDIADAIIEDSDATRTIRNLRARLAEVSEASDRFEAESEQKGANLMACEGQSEEYKADNQRLYDRLGDVMSRAGLVCIAKDNEREQAIEELRAVLAKGESK